MSTTYEIQPSKSGSLKRGSISKVRRLDPMRSGGRINRDEGTMNISFSEWVALADRNDIHEVNNQYSGVYLIANRVRRDSEACATSNRIIYIGRATNLKSRLNAFDKACECFYGRHAGGNKYHRMKINPRFDDLIVRYKRKGYKKNERRERYANYLRRHRGIRDRWLEKRNNISVAVWTPRDDDLGEYSILPEEHQLALVEVKLQANYFLQHNRLPRCNKRMG